MRASLPLCESFFRTAAAVLLFGAGSATGLAAENVKLGVGLDLSGPFAGIGIETRDGIQLALKLLGDKLGGIPVQVFQADTGGNPDQAKQVVDRMLQQNKIDLFTGPLPSNVALAVAPALFAAKVPFVSSNPGPSQFAGVQCNRYFIGLHYQNDAWDEAMGVYATQAGHKSAYLIAPNYPAGRDHLTGFKRRFKGEVVAEVYSKLGQLDYAAELAEVRAKKPDAVYFFLPGGMGINFIKQFLAAGLPKETKLLLGPTSGEPDTIQAVGEPMLGMVSAAQWAPDLPNPANQKFVAEFRKAFNRQPSVFAAQAYDTLLALDAAVKDVKGKVEDREAVVAALKSANYESVRGRIKLGNNNFPIQDYYLRSVVRDRDGSLVNKTVGTPLKAHSDAYHEQCKLK